MCASDRREFKVRSISSLLLLLLLLLSACLYKSHSLSVSLSLTHTHTHTHTSHYNYRLCQRQTLSKLSRKPRPARQPAPESSAFDTQNGLGFRLARPPQSSQPLTHPTPHVLAPPWSSRQWSSWVWCPPSLLPSLRRSRSRRHLRCWEGPWVYLNKVLRL